MSTQETEIPDCQERVGLKRKPTGPPRLLLGKAKSKDKPDSQRRQRRDKCCEDTAEIIDKQEDSPQKPSEMEVMKTKSGDTSGILVTLEENQGKDENVENKSGMTSKTTIKRTFSSLLCSGRKRKESGMERKEDGLQNTSMNENKQCDADTKTHEKSKRSFFFMVWPISKRSSVRRCTEQGSTLLQETPPKASFKRIYRIFQRRRKHPPVDHIECDVSKTTHNDVDLNQLSTDNMEIPSIPKQDQLERKLEIDKCASEIFTVSAEVSSNTNIESGHADKEQEICPEDEDKTVLSTKNNEKHPSTNEIGLLDSCCSATSNALDDKIEVNESNRNDIKCRPVITIDRVYTPEENQESHVNEMPRFDFLSMNGSWQRLQINNLTNNTLHPSDPSLSPELYHSRCNETLLIQTAISMVQAAIRGAVEQLANEQKQNQISLDSV